MFKAKNKACEEPLEKQKIAPRHRKNKTKRLPLFLKRAIPVFAFALLIFLIKKQVAKIPSPTFLSTNNYIFYENSRGILNRLNPEKEVVITNGLLNENIKTCEDITKKTIENSNYMHVRCKNLYPRYFVIIIEKFEPIFTLEADYKRYVSTEGLVYGNAETQSEQEDKKTLIHLKGVFDREKTEYKIFYNQLILQDEESNILKEAITLQEDLRELKKSFSQINYSYPLGFSTELEGGTSVLLGRAPFTSKIRKLNAIIKQLSQTGKSALRIELDYYGKAFILTKRAQPDV